MYGYAYRYSARAGKLSFNPASLPNTQFYSDPTIQSSVNSNLCQSLDGSTDALNADALVGDLASTTTGIWAGWVKVTDTTPLATERFIGFGDTNAVEWLSAWIQADGRIGFGVGIAGTTQWVTVTDAAELTDGVWAHLSFVMDGVEAKIYVNSSLVAQTFSVSTDKTKFFNSATGIDNGRLGVLNYNSTGNTGFVNSDIDEFGFWSNSTAVTAASLYNSGAGKTLTDLTTAEQVGLVGYYTLNDYLDTSGNSNTLTAIGTPTDAIGKVQTEVIAGENVYTLGDLAPSSNDGTQTTLINEPIWNTTHITYATNDFINIDDVLTDIATATVGTFGFWVRPTDATPLTNMDIIAFGDASATEEIRVQLLTTGKLRFLCRVAGTVQWLVDTDAAAFSDGVWSYVTAVQDGTPKLYIDDVLVAQTTSISTSITKWFLAATGLDTGRVGCINFNSGGDSNFLTGDIQQIYISTDVKDAATRTKLYENNQP